MIQNYFLKTVFLIAVCVFFFGNVNAQECDISDDLSSGFTSLSTPNGWTCNEHVKQYEYGGIIYTVLDGTRETPGAGIGVLTSPVLSNGCNSLSFSWEWDMNDYGDNGASFKLELKKGDEIVWNDTITNLTPASYETNNVSYNDLNIEGEVQLVITNLRKSSAYPYLNGIGLWNFCFTNYVAPVAQCDHSDDFAAFHVFAYADNYTEPYYQTSPAGWKVEDACKHADSSEELYLGGGKIADYARGLLRSPLFSGGCTKVKLSYKPYLSQDTKLKVAIKQANNIVWSDTIIANDNSTWMEFSADVDIAGEFNLILENITNAESQLPSKDIYIKSICLTDYIPVEDNVVPTIPTELTVQPADTSIAISWRASTDNIEVKGYNIYLDNDSINTITDTSYVIGGLTPATEYVVGVEAFDYHRNKSDKALITVSVPADVTIPTTPSNLAGVSKNIGMILSWTASTDNVGVAKYNIYVDGMLTSSTTSLTDTITGLAKDTQFQFAIEAEDASGNKSDKVSATLSTTIDQEAPTIPSNLLAEMTERGIKLSWTASTDNFGVANYNVYVDGELAGSVNTNTDTISGLIAGNEYLFEVEATDTTGNKSGKASVTVMGESTAGLSFSYLNDLVVSRIRSTHDYSTRVKFTDLFNYPDNYSTNAHIADSSSVTITFSATNDSHLAFEEYYWSNGQYFYYNIPEGAYGTDTLTISIDYHGFTAKALVVANVVPFSAGDDSYTVNIGESVELNVTNNDAPSAYINAESLEVLQNQKVNYGTLTNNNNGTLTYVNKSSTPNYSYEEFEYRIADTDGNYDTATVKINIHKNSYASRVIEFMPAPGQFTNESIGQSNSAEKTLGTQDGTISLGAFGGYVIYGFDQPITNNPKNPYGVDFSVKGNAFAANLYGVWTEPAAVRVMKDTNGDGIPNDGEWYELAGSDYYMSSTQKNVKMTYYNPHYDERYTVPWKKDNGETGALLANAFHQHPYYPDPFDFGCSKDSMTYEGSIIKSSLDMSTPSYIEFYRAPFFGYCDNRGNSSDLTDPQNPYYKDEKGKAADGFDLSWAVDRDGNHKELDQIDFVKIYTGGFANAGWLGEWSSEILGVGITTPDPDYAPQDYYVNYIGITQLKVLKGHNCQFEGFLFKNGRPQTEGTQQWSSSNTEVGTIDNTGLFTAVDNGETWLYFSQKNDIPTDSIRMLVVELEGVMLEMEGNSAASSDSTSLIVGESISITAQGLDNIGDVLNGSTSNRFVYDTYTWTTSNPEIGTVDNGLFTGKKAGRTTVYAHSDSNPELSDSMLVIVNEIPKLSPVSDPVIIGYYDTVGEKTSSELFTTGTNSTTYLNSVASKNGLANPVIEKNVLKCNFPEGVYGIDTLIFNLTSYRQDTTISLTFIHQPDVREKEEQILFVNNALTQNPDKSSLVAYTPGLDTINVIDDQLDAYSVNDVLVDGAFAFVSGDTYLSKYNLTNYEQECTTAIDNLGSGTLAVYGNLVLLAKQSELVIYYKVDLAFCKKIAFTGKISNVKVVGDKAYVFLSNETIDELTSVAVVELVKGEKQSENTLANTGFTASSIIANGTSIYLLGTVSSSGNTAVMEYNTQTENDLLTENDSKLSNSLKANATITGDSILIPAGEGFVSYNISTKRFGAETLMKAQEDFYPTSITYHPPLNKYFATYSNAAQTVSKSLIFDSEFAEVSTFDSVQTAPAFLTVVDAFDNNDKPLPDLSQTLEKIIYESTTYSVDITIAKNCFVDGENNFEIYPRYLEHTSWLTWNTNYTSLGNKKLDAFFTNTVDKDSVITIPVDAIDNYGFSATRFLNVTIKPRFYKPIVANPIADTVVVVNSADIKIPLADVFLNTPKRKVTFGKTVSGNSNTDLIFTEIINDTLKLSFTPNKVGETLITVKDSAKHKTYGVKYVKTSFKVTVVDNEEPSTPENFTSIPSEKSVVLSWTASTDNVGVAGYVIYLDGDSISTVTETVFTASNLDAVTEYTFDVQAFDTSGNKSEKASITVTTTDETAPSVPADLAATATETSISLSWTASTDNVGVVGYVIYLDGDSIDVVTETSLTIIDLEAGSEYTFDVEALDGTGNRSEKATIVQHTIITGVESWELNKLKVYPNPFADYFMVDAKKSCNAIVCDLSGKAIFNVLLQPGSNRIDASELPTGIYLLKQDMSIVKLIRK